MITIFPVKILGGVMAKAVHEAEKPGRQRSPLQATMNSMGLEEDICRFGVCIPDRYQSVRS